MTIKQRPNVIIMYADDLGYGDLGCYGAASIPTPNVDRLAQGGLRFTEGYAAAATCTPSRYSLLTGIYPWRNSEAAILPGDAPMIIEPGSPTLANMFQEAGYCTGVVGKWHLGLGRGSLDWNSEINPCPLDVGFDYSYIMAATNDRVPCVYVENRKVDGLDPNDPIEVTYDQDKPFPGIPTGKTNPELLRMGYSHGHDMSIINGVSRIGYMRGGTQALWNDETMGEVFLGKAVSFIKEHAHEPFFLYYALHQPHVPRLPNPQFAGKSGLGPRGDVIMEMDWCVGQLLDSLEEQNLMENTIVIFSSDNGPVLDDGYQDQAVELVGDHRPAGNLRGGKYSMYDGGTKVPFIISWPGTVKPGISDAVVCHIDFFASFASLLGQELTKDAALDSLDLSAALLGTNNIGRKELVTEGTKGKLVLHRDDWVYIPPYAGPAVNKNVNIELGNAPQSQLYNLSHDLGQKANVAEENSKLTDQMKARLDDIQTARGTRPGINGVQ
ncbi:MAG: arylsulfatase [Firmicutes bacterium]|nr:arylsulfatase [Bacillota bacterium]